MASPVALASQAAAAGACREVFATEKVEHPYRKFKSALTTAPQVSITTFGGMRSFHESRTVTYNQGAGGVFTSGTQMHVINHDLKTSSQLDELQKFPLGKMTETGYLTPRQAKMFGALGASLDVRQITFYEASREANSKEDLERYPTDLLGARLETRKGKLVARTASLWSVSGQVVTREGTKPVQLPWEKEDARKGQALDRKKYRFVWEWGRASQDIAGEVDALTSASVGDIYTQLVELGGRIEDAYVMMHSFDKVNSRLYAHDNPGTLYPADWKDQNDSLFLVPLAHLIAKHPPSRFSARVKGLIDVSKGMFTEIEAVNLLAQVQHLRWREWDLEGANAQAEPIVVTDWSHATMMMIALRLETYPFKNHDDFNRVLEFLMSLKSGLHSPNFNKKYVSVANTEETGPNFYQKLGAIEISNINPSVARKDPHAVATLLVHTYANIMAEIAMNLRAFRHMGHDESMNEAMSLLEKYDVNFGITSLDAFVLMQIHRLGPIATDLQGQTRNDKDQHIKDIAPFYYSGAQLNAFSAKQILTLWQDNEEFFQSRGYHLGPGYWSKQYHSTRGSTL